MACRWKKRANIGDYCSCCSMHTRVNQCEIGIVVTKGTFNIPNKAMPLQKDLKGYRGQPPKAFKMCGEIYHV